MGKIYNLFLIIFILLSIIGCSDTSFLSSKQPESNEPIINLKEFKTVSSTNDKLDNEVYAETATVYEKQEKIDLGNVKVNIYDEYKESSILQSNAGTLDLNTKNFTLKGDVKYNSKKIDLETETLNWDNLKQIIYTNDYFKQRQELKDGRIIEISGNGFSTDKTFEKLKVLKNAKINVKNK